MCLVVCGGADEGPALGRYAKPRLLVSFSCISSVMLIYTDYLAAGVPCYSPYQTSTPMTASTVNRFT